MRKCGKGQGATHYLCVIYNLYFTYIQRDVTWRRKLYAPPSGYLKAFRLQHNRCILFVYMSNCRDVRVSSLFMMDEQRDDGQSVKLAHPGRNKEQRVGVSLSRIVRRSLQDEFGDLVCTNRQ